MKALLTAALLFLAGSAQAAGAGCQDTTGGLVLEKVRAGAVGSQPWGCINRTIDTLSTLSLSTETYAALSLSTAALSASTEALSVALDLKANLAGATFTGASGITNQSFTATGPNGLIISGSSVNASAFFGDGSALTNIPNMSPCDVGAGTASVLCEGVTNSATGLRSTVSGGSSNIAGGDHSVVAGGASNSTGDSYGVVSGGFGNVANGAFGNITGGSGNEASGDYSTAVGGISNDATADYAYAAGRRAKAAHTGAFVWADSTNSDYASTIADSFNVRAAGGGFFSAHLNVLNSSVNASGFFGSGYGLTNIEPGNLAAGLAGISITGSAALNVLKTGDTMTGRLTAPDLTLTYGVSAATLAVSGVSNLGSVGIAIGAAAPGTTLDVGGNVRIRAGSPLIFQNAAADANTNISSVGGSGTSYLGLAVAAGAAARVGIGVSPATTLDVNGNAQFGSGATKSTFSATGYLTIPAGSSAGDGLRVASVGGQIIAAGGTITANACGGIKRILSNGDVTTSTSQTITTCAAALDGCAMDIVSIDSADTITLDFNGNTVFNGGTDVVLGPADTMRVVCDGISGVWRQIGATGNN